jgi:hypothetical protein
MPKKLIQDVYVGKENREENRMAEYTKYKTDASVDEVAQEAPQDDLPA